MHNIDFYEKVKTIDKALEKNVVTDGLFELLRKEPYGDYFFRNVNSVTWFYPLKEKGYFSPRKAPCPKPEAQKGYFGIPEWKVLPYLERVSQQVSIEGKEKYANELLGIIEEVTRYHILHGRKLDNYRTWWYFVKILINIPNDKIIQYLRKHKVAIRQDWIKEWITSKFDNTLPASEISKGLLPKFLTGEKSDIEIAEKIIEAIITIKLERLPKERIKPYGKKAEPKTIVDSHWLVECFKKNGHRIGQVCSENVIYCVANTLKRVLIKQHGDYQISVDFDTNKWRIRNTRSCYR